MASSTSQIRRGKLPLGIQPKYRDRRAVITEIRRLRRAGQDLSHKYNHDNRRRLFEAACRCFGSWGAAVEAAGFNYARVCRLQKWDTQKILQQLRQLYKRGHDLSSGHMQHSPDKRALYQATLTHFGQYRAAIKAAGIDYENVRHLAWPPSRIIAMIRKMRREGKDLSMKGLRKQKLRACLGAAARRFGGWRQAVEAAGIDYAKVRKPHWAKKWTGDRVVEALGKLCTAGKDLSPVAMKRAHSSVYLAARRYFGTYRAALTKAGIDYLETVRKREWTPEKVITSLRAAYDSGTYMSSSALRSSQKYPRLVAASNRLFGTWRKALKAADIPPPVRMYRPRKSLLQYWTDSLILDRLRELNRQGGDLRDRPMKTRHHPLYWAARDHFGTYINAVKQAGIDYDRVVQRALRKMRVRGNRPTA